MEYSSPFYILIMLSFSVTVDSTYTDGECRELSFPARFFFRGKRLDNHVITTVQVRDLGVCELLCYHNHNCVSINFEVTKSHDNKHRCDLNNATHQKHDNEFQNADYFLYRGADSACDTAHCYGNATCQSGFTSKGYKCLCPPGFGGEHCKQGCPEGWNQYNVSCYNMTGSQSTDVSDARQKCKDMGADLPVIYSNEENDFIKKNFNDKLPEGRRLIWLGLLRNNSANSTFFWVDGTPIKGNYAAWQTGEPNNSNSNENCACIRMSGKWNDFPCEFGVNNGPYVLCQMAM